LRCRFSAGPKKDIVARGERKMNKNAGLDLGDHFASFIEAQIAQGRYD